MPRPTVNSRLIRFGIVGTLNTFIDFGLLFLLKSLGLPIVTSNIISSGTAFVVSFFANKTYTFKTDGGNVVREMILFTIVTLFGLWVLQSIVLSSVIPFFTNLTHNRDSALMMAKLAATAVSLIWNYILYSKFVFTHRGQA